ARSGSTAPYSYEANQDELYHCLSLKEAKGAPVISESNGVCKAGRGICSISPVGDVFPCLLMPLKVGNLRQTRFTEIWQANPSPDLTYLRSITWEDLSSCRDCSLARYCKRCMGVALSETGGLTKPAPSACRYTALKSEFFKRKGVIV
ncbi:SPASM domain-containing protein, partial [Chloroflexota bacterium]